ncbi:hypothetical protein HD806DRAFT_505515 [Xylariaceae sp. AK1471]|nr:hypothetical protein HD806DRAFT_505515 [Xylariaceae sp. AK1471]
MFRVGSSRSILRCTTRAVSSSKQHASSLRHLPVAAPNRLLVATRIIPGAVPAQLPVLIQRAFFATKSPNGFQQGINSEEDKKVAQRKLTPHPESVTTESSVRHLYEPVEPDKDNERPVTEGVKDDLKIVQGTFSLSNVPKEPYWLGLAGTLPYLGTSVSTVYLAWVLNTEWPASSTFANNLMINHETASQLLATLEPIQLGYGAVIISFLGAIHWGLEYAEKAPDLARTRFRYGLGVMASVIAWPTLFMPVEFALTSQFAAFVALYFADARATVRGWAPSWYSTYRFALTAVVGVALVISLIGRAKVGDASPRLTGLGEKFHEHRGEEEYSDKWQKLEQKEREKIKKQQEEAEKKEKEEKEKKEKAKKEDKAENSNRKQGKGRDEDHKQEGGKEEGDKG